MHIQQMVFDDPNSLVSCVVNTVGTPEKVDGGYRWTGQGFFSSGVDHCNWLIAAIDLAGDQPRPAQPDRRWFLMRRDRLRDRRRLAHVGLRAPAARRSVMKDASSRRTAASTAKELSEGTGIGARQHGGPLYCAAMDFTFSLPLAGPRARHRAATCSRPSRSAAARASARATAPRR